MAFQHLKPEMFAESHGDLFPSHGSLSQKRWDYPLVICYSWQFIFDLPIKNGDFPVRYVNLPEGTVLVKGL